MGYSVVKWDVSPDTWMDVAYGQASEKKFLIKSGKSMFSMVDGILSIVALTEPITAAQYLEHGFNDLSEIGAAGWQSLERPVEILYWTDNADVTGVDVAVTRKDFKAPTLELTVPEYTAIDVLERPLKVLTYTDGAAVPVLRGQYSMQNVGTRIMKRGE